MKRFLITFSILTLSFFIFPFQDNFQTNQTSLAEEAQRSNPSEKESEQDKPNQLKTIKTKILDALLYGASASLFASLIFYIVLSQLKPKLKLSEVIAHQNHEVYGDLYIIKLVNHTKAKIDNVKIAIYQAKIVGKLEMPSSWKKLKIKRKFIPKIDLMPLKIGIRKQLVVKEVLAISEYNQSLQNSDAPYAVHIPIPHKTDTGEIQNIKEIVDGNNGESFLLIRIYARHSFSGFSSLFEERYEKAQEDVVICGEFNGGGDLKITGH